MFTTVQTNLFSINMLSSVIIALAFIADVTPYMTDCNLPVYEACPYNSISRSIPTTSEELDITCNATTNVLECSIAFLERCEKDPELLHEETISVIAVKDICNKSGPLYPAVVNNLECGKEFFENRANLLPCFSQLEEETLLKHVKALIGEGVVEEDDAHDTTECIRRMHSAACLGVELEKSCGENAVDTYVAVAGKVAELFVYDCARVVEQLLPTVIRLYKLEEQNVEELD